MNRIVALAALVLVAAGAAAAGTPLRAHNRHAEAWKWTHECAPADEVNLVFAVRQRNVEAARARLDQVSDPTHPDYTQYMTLAELGDMMRDDAAVDAVEQWLAPFASQVQTNVNGDFIRARLTASQANKMLQAEFHAFKHEETGQVVFRTAEATLPDSVSSAIDYVARVVDFPRRSNPSISFSPKVTDSASNAGDATPPVIQKYYGIPNNKTTVAGSAPSISVFEALGQNYEPSDVAKFQKKFNLAVNPAQKIVGPNSAFTCVFNPNACGEASLDVQVISLTNGLPWVYWSIAGTDQTPFVDWAQAVSNDANPPLVNSISYGGEESQEPVALQQRFNTEIMKLGLRGVSVLIASGDDGVAGAGARQDPTKCGFNPSFPATIPYVTSVGATMGPESGSEEVACTSDNGGLITSGGGFSAIFPSPSYQQEAVQGFLQNGVKVPPTSLFNSSGRAYPDVALLGHNYEILISGQTEIGSGTSASTPLFAAIVALVNNQRIAAGKKPLGFLNPALYQQAKANPTWIRDVTKGENNCAAGQVGHEDCCKNGFTAGPGWDAVTGFGSVDYQKFASVFGAL